MSILHESKTESLVTKKANYNHALQIVVGVVLGGLAAVISVFEIITQLRKRKSVSIPIEISRK